MKMRCAALTRDLDSCTRHPLPYGDYCRQHQHAIKCDALLDPDGSGRYAVRDCAAPASPGSTVCEQHATEGSDPDGTRWPYNGAVRKDNVAQFLGKSWNSPDGHDRWGLYSCMVVTCADTETDRKCGYTYAQRGLRDRAKRFGWLITAQRTRVYRGLESRSALAVSEILIVQPPLYVVCASEYDGPDEHRHGPFADYNAAEDYRDELLRTCHHMHTRLLPADDADCEVPSA